MPRKPKPSCERLTCTVAVRLTEVELTALDRMIESLCSQAWESSGMALRVSRGTFMRNLIRREMDRLNTPPPRPSIPDTLPKRKEEPELVQGQFET